MRNSIINWKGSPHRQLPQIRIASSSYPSIRDPAQAAAEEVLKRPLAAALEKERRKYQFKVFLRGRIRSSRASSATFRARRRATQRLGQRARQNIQIFGWESAEASKLDQSCKTSLKRPGIVQSRSGRSIRFRAHSDHQTPKTGISSVDGASNSVPSRYSLMNVAEAPPYWGKLPKTQHKNIHSRRSRSKRQPLEYANVGAPETATTRNLPPVPPKPEPNSTLDHRIDQSKPPSKRPPRNHHLHSSCVGTRHRVNYSKGPSVTWDNQSLKANSRRFSVASSTGSIVQSLISNASRTPSEKQAIDRFSKGLQSYLQAYEAQPNEPLLRSASPTTISAYTIEELKPYQAEFQAAGLAVTSKEQKAQISKLPKAPAPPPTPVTDFQIRTTQDQSVESSTEEGKSSRKAVSFETSEMGTRGGKKKEKEKAKLQSVASGSTGTTVLGFTPPHHKSYPPSGSPIKRLSSSSDHTVLGFIPPHDRSPGSQAPGPTSSSKTPTKKTLPWLRKANQTSPDEGPSPQKVSYAYTQPCPPRPSTPLRGWVSYAHEGEPFPEPRESPKKNEVPSRVQPSISTSKGKEPQREMVTQTYDADAYLARGLVNGARIADDYRAAPGTRRRTVPNVADSYQVADHVGHPNSRALKQKSDGTRNPVHESTQTEATRRKHILPVAPVVTQGLAVTEATPIVTKTDLYFDEEESRTRLAEITTRENNLPFPPPRRGSSPKLCTQCSKKIEVCVPEEPKFERGAICPNCGTRSCLTCQQCFPSRQNTYEYPPTPPRQLIEVVNEPSQQEPTIPTETFIYVDPPRPSPVEQALKDAIQSFPDEERFAQGKIIEEMITEYARQPPLADPVKRTPPWRARLRPDFTVQSPDRTPISGPRAFHTKPLSQDPEAFIRPAMTFPQGVSTFSLDSSILESDQVSNKQVFKGLQVATAAACDKDVDKWLEEITGTSARRFLADLNAFEDLGINALSDVAKRAAKQRRNKLRAWEAVRRQRVEEEKMMGEIVREDAAREAMDREEVLIEERARFGKGRDERF